MINPIITISELSHSYADGTKSIHCINLQINPGESVAIIGPNGAGKTSLFLCIAGLVTFKASTFNISGINALEGNNKSILPSKAALLFQDSDDQLFCPTVEEDIAFGPINQGLSKAEVKQRVEIALEEVGLIEKRNKVPHQLSGGEKRRVALAGLLSMNPDILLLDEPSQFLDHRSRRSLINILNKNNHTKLIATHDFEMALETCTRAILLDQGKIEADGAIKTILADESLLKKHGMEVPYSLKSSI